MDWTLILEMMLWFGLAATGFAVLFNVPSRALPVIFFLGALGGLTKQLTLHWGASLIVASLCSSFVIGLLTIPFAHIKHAPPLVFSIPSVIPLVPGVLAFRMMQGLITLAGDSNPADYVVILSSTINNGLRVMFILFSLAAGVALPMLLTRKESVKHVKLRRAKS